MCEWCGAPPGLLEGFSVVERPAQRLVGRVWEGTYSEAAAGALLPLFAEAKAAASGGGLWAGPIIGISWNDRPDGFRYFVGLEVDGTGAEAGGGAGASADVRERLDIPSMRFANAWHDAGDGEVVDHYQAMLGWIEREGLTWDKSAMHHREEHPLHGDLAAAPALRLMVPVR
jgi:hypothetical protein